LNDRGETYEGEWKDNLRHGQGLLTFGNGDSLSGCWVEDLINGSAIYKSAHEGGTEKREYEAGQVKTRIRID